MMTDTEAARRSRIARVGSWCFNHRRVVFAIWLLALIAVTGLGRVAGDRFTDNLNGGSTQAEQARTLLQQRFPAYAGDAADVVFQSSSGLSAPSTRRQVQATVDRLRQLPQVTEVHGPFDVGASGQVSADGTTAYATVQYNQ